MRLPLNTICLAVVNLLLLVLIGERLVQGTGVDAISNAVREPTALQVVRLDAPPPRDLSGVQAQALFYRTRAFYVAPVTPVLEQPPPDYRFAGSMTIPNQSPTALLVHNQTNARIKVAAGNTLEGWSVAQVGPRSIVITQGHRTLEITMANRGQGGGMTAVSSEPRRTLYLPPANQQ